MRPADADFGLTIDFKKGASDPVKIFDAMTALLEGFKKFDQVIVGSLDPEIHPMMVLEDVETNSITAWVRSTLRQVDDDALKEFDWKKQVGSFVVKAKHKALDYLDKRVEANEKQRLEQLRDDIYKLAQDVDVRHLPLPTSIKLIDLAAPLDDIQEAKKKLSKSDRVIFKADGWEHQIDLSSTKKPSDFIADDVASTTSGEMEMTLLVRKPDYLGNTMWEFRHGQDTLTAHITDEDWLKRFRSGQEIIVPGSALVSVVAYDYSYNAKGELTSAKHTIIQVRRIIHNREQQGHLAVH